MLVALQHTPTPVPHVSTISVMLGSSLELMKCRFQQQADSDTFSNMSQFHTYAQSHRLAPQMEDDRERFTHPYSCNLDNKKINRSNSFFKCVLDAIFMTEHTYSYFD